MRIPCPQRIPADDVPLHGFRITGLALQGAAIFTTPAAWAIAFLLTGLNEELLCRGYLRYMASASGP